jgi:hypothetical protein
MKSSLVAQHIGFEAPVFMSPPGGDYFLFQRLD